MFEVMCISSGTPGKTEDKAGNKGVYVPSIHVGSDYIVVDEQAYKGDVYYELLEIPPSVLTTYWYNSKLFALKSTNTEKEELVNTKEECV